MTRSDQMHINTAYASIRDALNELAQVTPMGKDKYLQRVQHLLYDMEDTIHQYVGPIREERNNG